MVRLVRAVYGNAALVLTAVVSACALWIYVDEVTSTDATLVVIPTFVGPDGRPVDAVAADAEGRPTSVRVTVHGARERVGRLSADALECVLRLPAREASGPMGVAVDRGCVSLREAAGVRVTRVEPARVTARPRVSPSGSGDTGGAR